ncbi:MAG: phosphoesterase, partial [Daejeonella sp.]|nr:phosphoesterase [Daejeonella sp.]
MLKIAMVIITTIALFPGCNKKQSARINDADILHNNEDQLTQIIIYDVFTPPVASRIYSYSSLAAYEAVRFTDPEKYQSIVSKLNGFNEMPKPEQSKDYNYTLAATKAFFTVVRKVVFSVDSLDAYENRTYADFKEGMDDSTYARSVRFGESVGKAVLERSATDNYKLTRGKPKFLGSNIPGEWRPTAPDYMDGVEYCWGTMKTFALDSSSQFPCPKPIKFSTDTNSTFYKQTVEVYNINKNLTPEQRTIAKYWDDNPFVIEHSGHMMFANKKITPGGHWIGITAIACKKSKADVLKTAKAYALTSVAMFDAFVSCWQDKYVTKVI